MSENAGTSTSHNPKGLHGLYRDNFIFMVEKYYRLFRYGSEVAVIMTKN
jgi:hypothetical protein